MRNRLIRLLTRMELIIPQKVTRPNARLARADIPRCNIAQIVLSCHIRRLRQVPGRVVVDIRHEGVDVEDRDRGSGIALRDQ